MNIECIEITVKQNVDPAGLVRYIGRLRGIAACRIKEGQTIEVSHDPRKLSAKKLLKLIAGYSDRDHRSKTANVARVREVQSK